MFTTTKATGHVGDSGPMAFIPTLREGADAPATMQLSMTLDVSLEDAAAALWILVTEGTELSELDNAEFVHKMVLETLFAEGGNRVAAARVEMNDQKRGTFEAHTAHALRSIVAAVYGTEPTEEQFSPLAGTRQCHAGRREAAR